MKLIIRALVVSASLIAPAVSHAQGASSPPQRTAGHPPVCAKGVRIYNDRSQVPVPFDTLRVPPSDGPVRVTNEQEMEAAELALKSRAGSVGATGVLITDVVEDDGGAQRLRRSVVGLFVRADSAKAQQACKP